MSKPGSLRSSRYRARLYDVIKPNRILWKMTLVQRILAAFGVTMILFLLITLNTWSVLQSLSHSAAEQTRISQASQTAHQLEIEALAIIILLKDYPQSRDRASIRGMIAERRAEIRQLSQRLRKLTRLDVVRRELDAFEALLPTRAASADRIMQATDRNASPEVIQRLRQERAALDEQARKHITAIRLIEEEALNRAGRTDERRRQVAKWRIGLVWPANIAVVLTVALLLARNLKTRLTVLDEMTEKISRGDYSARVAVTGQDELDRLAQSFNTMAARLSELEKVKSDFLALASHQLRTPATGVKGNLGLLIEGYCGELTAEQREVLDDAYQSNERQLAVIEDMLAVARVEAGQMVLDRAPTDLSALLRSVVAEQKTVIGSRQQTISLELPDEPVIVSVDGPRLRMVFENLVNNASKYSFTGGSVRVRLFESDQDICVAVSDTGVGINEKDLHKLYKKFSRIDNPLSRSVSGTGLGLYLAYEIVRLHDGAITAHSEIGKGATFTVRLPKGSDQ